jgi:alpha-galactosidase
MTAEDKAILMNRDVIDIDQDALGKQAERVWQRGDFSLWRKPLTGGRYAIGLVNNSWSVRDVPVDLNEIGFASGASVHNVWAGKDLGRWTGPQSLTMQGHSVELWIFKQ